MKHILSKLFYALFIIFLMACNNESNEELPPVVVVLDSNIEVYNENLVENSYVLAVKNGGTDSFLLDKTGKKIYEWSFDTSLGNDLELLPNGKLLGMFKADNPEIHFGGFGGVVKILNIDGSTDWEFNYASSNYISHHDVEILPNGNVLFLVWERIEAALAKEAGVNTEVDIFPEALLEVNPDTNQIVWEWHSFDHIIQEEIQTSPTFGSISDNPQLIDFNYHLSDSGDIMHANGIDHDEILDVIYISINNYSEVWVIDHSTTLAEAQSNIGGNYGKGGNLLYRFGNPEAYNNSAGERLFYNNHFPNLLENNVPGEGNILIYVNGNNVQQSSVYELKMPATFNLTPNVKNEPETIWSFTDSELYFGIISGAVRLNNGNTLICEGDYGFWEITPSKEIAWKYNVEEDKPFCRCYSYAVDAPEIRRLGL